MWRADIWNIFWIVFSLLRLHQFHLDHLPLLDEIDAYGDFLQALGPEASEDVSAVCLRWTRSSRLILGWMYFISLLPWCYNYDDVIAFCPSNFYEYWSTYCIIRFDACPAVSMVPCTAVDVLYPAIWSIVILCWKWSSKRKKTEYLFCCGVWAIVCPCVRACVHVCACVVPLAHLFVHPPTIFNASLFLFCSCNIFLPLCSTAPTRPMCPLWLRAWWRHAAVCTVISPELIYTPCSCTRSVLTMSGKVKSCQKSSSLCTWVYACISSCAVLLFVSA